MGVSSILNGVRGFWLSAGPRRSITLIVKNGTTIWLQNGHLVFKLLSSAVQPALVIGVVSTEIKQIYLFIIQLTSNYFFIVQYGAAIFAFRT